MLGLVDAFAQHAFGDRVLRLHHRLGGFADRDLANFGDLGFAPDHIDLVFLHQKRDAAIELLRHAARAFDHIGNIDAHRAVQSQAVILGMIGIVKDFSRAQQGFGRNTAPIQANPAQMLAFHQSGFETQLGRTDRRHIATRTTTDNQDIINRIRHDRCSLKSHSRRLHPLDKQGVDQ